jgi:hypothetical protein
MVELPLDLERALDDLSDDFDDDAPRELDAAERAAGERPDDDGPAGFGDQLIAEEQANADDTTVEVPAEEQGDQDQERGPAGTPGNEVPHPDQADPDDVELAADDPRRSPFQEPDYGGGVTEG